VAQSSKSNLIKANAICWSAAVLVALILTYGPHGPAQHPKMMLIFLMPVAMISLRAFWSNSDWRFLFTLQCVLWIAALATAFTLANTSLGDSVPTYAVALVTVVLGAISMASAFRLKTDEPA